MKKIKPYSLVSQKTWELLPEKSHKLDWNEGDFNMIEEVKNDLVNFIKDKPLNWYPNLLDHSVISGLRLLENNKINKDMIQYFAGSDSIHRTVVNCFLKENDKVLIIKPSYDNFRYLCEVNGVQVEYFKLKDDGIINFELLGKAISNDIKLVYFVNPNNPTGLAYPIDELNEMIKEKLDTYFLIDEAYSDFWGHTMVDSINEHINVIVTKTMSKSFGLAGFRFGYCVASKDLIDLMNYFRNPKDINTLSLVAVKSTIKHIDKVREYISEVRIEREKLRKLIESFSWITSPFDSTTNFLLLKLDTKKLKIKFIDHLTVDNIFVRDFNELFESDSYLRISIGNSITMKRLSESIIKFSNSL
jgi:histidinol-phosphate aminotransferase